MGEGSARFLAGTAVGAAGGFVLGSVAASPATRSVSRSVAESLATAAAFTGRFTGRLAIRMVDGFGSAVEAGYTRVRGREAYLEHEIAELREKISDLERKMD